MSISLSKEKLIEVLKGASLAGSTPEKISFAGVEYDSREIKGGELFIALKGGANHGHQFVKQAFERGASICLVEDSQAAKNSEFPERCVVVEDTLKAFWELASYWRNELAIPVLAVTGSVGKTTIKEMTASLLLRREQGVYSLKSHNNQTGVPYTICRAARHHRWAVLEMGMNHAGELRALSLLAKPDIVAISVIAPAHIENLGSLEKIAQAKLEIIEGLAPQGTIILNADDSVLASEFAKLPRRKGQVLYFGTGDAVQSSVSSVVSRGLEGIGFELTLFGERAHITMKVMGKQNAMNGACAALCARTLYPDLGIDQIRAGLSNFQAPLMRLNVRTLEDERIIIDDSYNANPASMKALVELAGELGDGKKRVGLVLGDMLELGEDSERFHLELGRQAAGINPHFLISVGKFAAAVAATAKAQQIPVFEAANAEQACSIAGSQQFDILLIKASRGVGLDKVVKHLCGDH